MEEVELKNELYNQYCTIREKLGVSDADIDNHLLNYISDNCNKYNIIQLNQYCKLPSTNEDLSKISAHLIVEFDRMYREQKNAEIEYEQFKKNQRDNEVQDAKSKWVKVIIAIGLLYVVFHFNWFGIRYDFNSAPMYIKPLIIAMWLGISYLFSYNFAIALVAFIVIAFINPQLMLIGSVAGFGMFIYDVIRPLYLKSKNSKLNKVSESRQQEIAQELNKKRKSVKEMMDDGSVQVIDVEEMRKKRELGDKE